MNKAHIILNWEQDWDQEHMYYRVTVDGKIQKYDVETETLYQYDLERVAH